MVQLAIIMRGQCHTHADPKFSVLSSFFLGKAQGNFSLVL